MLTDEAGRYYFPPLAAGKYRVWAQALSFATAKGEIDLGVAKKHDFTLRPMENFFHQLPGNVMLSPRLTGLSKDSVANVSQIVSLDKALLTDRAGRLPRTQLALVLSGIDVVLGR